MNVQEMYNAANRNFNATISKPDVIIWFNEFQRRINKFAKIEDEWTINLVAGTANYDLPITNISSKASVIKTILEAKLGTDDYMDFNDFANKNGIIIRTNQIRFTTAPTENGVLTLFGHKYLSDLVGDGDIPEIQQDYHDLYVDYASKKYILQEEEDTTNISNQLDAIVKETARLLQGEGYVKQTKIIDVYGGL